MMFILVSRMYVTVYLYELTFHLHPKDEQAVSGRRAVRKWEKMGMDRSLHNGRWKIDRTFWIEQAAAVFSFRGFFLNKEHNDGCRKENPRSITKRRV